MLAGAFVPPMPSFTYVARRPGPFSALVQAAELGGLQLSPLPPVRVVDRYFDTVDGELLRRGLALRVREQDGERVAGLRQLSGDLVPVDDRTLDARLDLETRLQLPVSPLAVSVRDAIGDDPLRPLLTLRQYRTPRVARTGTTPAGILSFDVVVFEVPGGRIVSNEIEIEPHPGGASLADLDEVLQEHGLELVTRSAFERAVLRSRRGLSEPVLLLPDERRQLEAAAAATGPVATLAQAVLLDSRGFRPDTIATQTGLGMARVRQIRERFREVRMDVLAPVVPPTPRRAAPVPAAPRPAAPSPEVTPTPSDPAESQGDGVASADLPDSMDDLLDLFQSKAPDTPHFGDDDDDDAPDVRPAPRLSRRRYPVVLGPVAMTAREPAFSEVDFESLQTRPAPHTATVEQPSARPASRPVRTIEAPPPSEEVSLLATAHATVSRQVGAFERASDRFIASKAPSDARRLVVAAHGLRLAVETFQPVLPAPAARRLVDALRPLVVDLDAALDYGRAALDGVGSGDVPAFLAQRAAWALDTAAARLRDRRQREWWERTERLLQQMKADSDAGRPRSDDAPVPADDFVGAVGEGAAPSRLSHILGSELWRRFEMIRSLGEELATPSTESARRLAVALGGLQFALGLAGRQIREARGDVQRASDAIEAAERAVTIARQRAIRASLVERRAEDAALRVVTDVWEAITARSFRSRLAAIVEAI